MNVEQLDKLMNLVGELVLARNQKKLQEAVLQAKQLGQYTLEDKLGAGGMGTITLRSRVDGGEAVVEVQDTGAGIPAKLAHRMFQPFFTTKAVGSGTGQGLALAWHIIVDNHHGKIDFSSTEGEGTTFVVRIPVLQLPAPEAAGRAAEAASAALRASQQPAPLTRRVP